VKALLNASLGRIRVNNMVTEPNIKAVNPACEVEILTSSDVGGASEVGLPNTFTYNSGTTPRQVQSSITAAAVENLDGPSPNNNCESTDLDFIYTFAGRVYNCDPNTGGCTTPVYITPGSGTTFECNTSIFNSNAYCSQPAGKLFAPLRTGFWYKGIFKQIVRPAANQNCSYLACYYSEETIDCSTNPTAIQGRIAVDNLAIYGGEMVDETQLGVFPNPVSSDLANIQVPKDGEGQFEIHDFTGKIMRTLNLKQGQNVLNLAQVPKGIYRLTNIRNRKVSVSFIKE
jgi:Secretion system C-terminal sorting domain